MSRFSAYSPMPRVTAMAALGPTLSYIVGSAGLHCDCESHAEMQRNKSFTLIIHNFSRKKLNSDLARNIY
jgi:hypothetical protein